MTRVLRSVVDAPRDFCSALLLAVHASAPTARSTRAMLLRLPSELLDMVRSHCAGSLAGEVVLLQLCRTTRAFYSVPDANAAGSLDGDGDADLTGVEDAHWRDLLRTLGLSRPLRWNDVDLAGYSWRQIACGIATHALRCGNQRCREFVLGAVSSSGGYDSDDEDRPIPEPLQPTASDLARRLFFVSMSVFSSYETARFGWPSAKVADHLAVAAALATGDVDAMVEYVDVGVVPLIEALATNEHGVTIIDYLEAISERCVSSCRRVCSADTAQL